MGVSGHSLLFPFVESSVPGEEDNCNSNGFLQNKAVMKEQDKKRKQRLSMLRSRRQAMISKRSRRILMKRRRRLESSRRSPDGLQRRVKTLRRLVPNSEAGGLDGLFKETADYIFLLQTRVKLMQILVNLLTGSDE